MAKNRWQILVGLLQDRPHKHGAEIGVFEGDTTVKLLEHLPGLELLLCVDPFEHYPEHTATLNPGKKKFYRADFREVEHKFNNRAQLYVGRVTVLKHYSTQAAPMVRDASLDFVFIDGNHAYDFVLEDITLWLPKVKPGGLLTGHDYRVPGYRGAFGVTRAVRDFFGDDHANIRHVWYHEVV
jgi:predicted O-methyltransferase YrrM